VEAIDYANHLVVKIVPRKVWTSCWLKKSLKQWRSPGNYCYQILLLSILIFLK